MTPPNAEATLAALATLAQRYGGTTMSGSLGDLGLPELLLGSDRPVIGGDRRRQAAAGFWIAAAACLAIGFGPVMIAPLPPTTFIAPIAGSILLWFREWSREEWRGGRAAAMLATVRIGFFWLLLAAPFVLSWMVGHVAPNEPTWLAGWWIAGVTVAVGGAFLWQRGRRQHLALIGVLAGLLLAFGSVAGFATGGAWTVVTVVGVPVGLGLAYASGRFGG